MKNIAIILLPLLFVFACNSQNNNGNNQQNSNSDSVLNKDTVTTENIIFNIKPQAEAKYPNIKSIPVPPGYERVSVEEGSFGEWLRNLNLKTENNDLYLYDGNLKYSQDLHFAVLKFDAGKRDLQQCADAVMRLRAEYLFAKHQYNDIHFNFLSDGKPRYFIQYGHGDKSYKKFRNYMNYIFSYANTASLKKELTPVKNLKDIHPGDVFIQSGRPYGHAVTVVDVAKNNEGDLIFMVSQSYMPAEEINIVKNLNNSKLSPWYKIYETPTLTIPEWEFEYSDLRRF